VHGSAEAELDLTFGQVIEYLARVGQRSRKAVQLCDDQRVAGAASGERFA